MKRSTGSNRGMALVTAIITSAVLITLAGASLLYSRSDVMVSDNAKHGSGALWIAQLGNERAKNELRKNGWWRFVAANGVQTIATAGTTYPGVPGATYATTVAPYPTGGLPSTTGKFLLDTTATAPDGTTSRVQEVVALAGANIALDAINLQGTGTHAKLEETGIGIPKYFVDARNHDRPSRRSPARRER
jgi:type II secretory pathway component PulK